MGAFGLKYDVLHFSFHLLPLSEFIVCTFFFMLKRSWDWISSMRWRGLLNESWRLSGWKYLHFNTDFIVIYSSVNWRHYELNKWELLNWIKAYFESKFVYFWQHNLGLKFPSLVALPTSISPCLSLHLYQAKQKFAVQRALDWHASFLGLEEGGEAGK